jgi:hypothetical protein
MAARAQHFDQVTLKAPFRTPAVLPVTTGIMQLKSTMISRCGLRRLLRRSELDDKDGLARQDDTCRGDLGMVENTGQTTLGFADEVSRHISAEELRSIGELTLANRKSLTM